MATDDTEELVNKEIKCAALFGIHDAPGISLHAITDVLAREFQTIKVYISIGMSRLYSTPARPITLLTSTWWGVPTFSFVPALGSRWLWRMACLASPGKTTAQAVHIRGGGGGKGEALDIDLYAFPLGKYDMVLGV